jgi:hypothetical protein
MLPTLITTGSFITRIKPALGAGLEKHLPTREEEIYKQAYCDHMDDYTKATNPYFDQ